MRILHTSDWHLGASLEGVSRDADQAVFLGWLTRTIEREGVDVLVVAGDIFDQAHPSAEAQRQYYGFLRRVADVQLRKIVIVGGNHDSASRLDAPVDVLQALDVHVVGGLESEEAAADRCLCAVPGTRGGTDAVVVAVPFVHEYRLGVRTALTDGAELKRTLEERLARFYRGLVDRAVSLHDGAPVIATGHLTCEGVEKGDSPADIHMVGTIGGLGAGIFDERLQYVALGHIHRSFRVGESRAYYSGSPIAMCLKEARTPRKVRLVDTSPDVFGAAKVRSLEVPSPRAIVELSGSVEAVAAQLEALAWKEQFPPIVFARVQVERFSTTVDETLRRVVETHGEGGPLLVQVRQEHRAAIEQPAPVPVHTRLADLAPEEVFRRLCAERQEPVTEELLNAFRSLLSARPEEAA